MSEKQDKYKIIDRSIDGAIAAVESLKTQKEVLIAIAERAIEVLENGGKIFFAGNGGSAADAQHAAAELVGKLGIGEDVRPLPAIALNTDTSALTALSNDYGFEEVFARQIRALGKSGDMFFAISTSGKSQNILKVAKEAEDMAIITIALTGPGESPLSRLAKDTIFAAGEDTPRIQAGHSAALHIICELIKRFV